MLNLLRRWRHQRIIDRSDTSGATWANAWNSLPLLEGLNNEESHRLKELAALFLHEKAIEPVAGMNATRQMRQFIALQACLPILALDIDWYRTWHSVILYPDTFVSSFEQQDSAGVVHRVREPRMGESWDKGPLILSWADSLSGGEIRDGYNVIIHECAHKLDALDGAANGKPPLHRHMNIQQWADVFGNAYENFCYQVDTGEATSLDPYGSEAPEEFFAVTTEAFFEIPHTLRTSYPNIYDLLATFFRHDPIKRLLST